MDMYLFVIRDNIYVYINTGEPSKRDEMMPDYQTIMLPLLKFTGDRQEHDNYAAVEHLATYFDLTEEEREEQLSSGNLVFANRVGWAKTYLKKAGLLESTRRGYFRITESGLDVLRDAPKRIDNIFLGQFPGFQEFIERRPSRHEFRGEPGKYEKTPEELMQIGHQELTANLESEILEAVKKCSPRFFEKLVVDLLVKMGYGGSREDAGEAIGRSHDGGIDGRIKEDRLGLDIIYIQAKKWDNPVGRPEVQEFAGALQGEKAKKGIFITTSTFCREAITYVSNIESKIVLIDGKQLAKLMVENNVGVSTIAAYEIKGIDSDFFIDESPK